MKFLLFILLSLSNTLIRGGLIKTILGKDIAGLRYTYSVMFGISFALVSNNPYFGCAMTVAMHLGSVWSLPLQNMLKGHWYPMTQRGVIWTAPLMAVLWYFYDLTALWYLPALFLMFPAYYLPKLYFDHHNSDIVFNRQTIGEVLYGDMLCLPILFI